MKISLFLALAMLVAVPALAGEIRGVVAASDLPLANERKIVIWVEGAPAGAVPAARPRLSQRDVRFAPDFLVVVAGQTVEMPNDDDIVHNVFSISPAKSFNLGLYLKGQSRSVTFDRPGPVDLFCKIHRHMNAKVYVVPNPFFAVTEPGQPYSIKGVPPGRYKLHVWHEHLAPLEKTVVVPGAGAISVPFALAELEK